METPHASGGTDTPPGPVIFSRIPCLAARMLLGGIFIWAGALKLMAPYRFAGMVSDYGIIPDKLTVPFAFILPILEILAGSGVILNLRRSIGMVTFLLLVFIAVLLFAKAQNLDIDCGCLSLEEAAEKTGVTTALVRDFFMLAAAGYIHLCRRYNPLARTPLVRSLRLWG